MRTLITTLALAGVAMAEPGMTCKRMPADPVMIRAEGNAELLPDIVLACTGGSPPASGAPAPEFQVLVVSNTPLSNRAFVPAKTDTVDPFATAPATESAMPWIDSLLVVDEAPTSAQIACAPPPGADGCDAGSSGAPNVYEGRKLLDNTIVFRRVQIAPPGSGPDRIIRIANTRVDATKVPTRADAPQATTYVQMFDASGAEVPIEGANAVGGTPQPGFSFALRTASDDPVPDMTPAIATTPALLSRDAGKSPYRFNLKFTEGFASAFRRRNAGTSADDPMYIANQSMPGATPTTESGFYNGAYPAANGMNVAGLADTGTRLRVVFDKVPDNTQLFVTLRDVSHGTTGYSQVSPKALLTNANYAGAGLYTPMVSYDAGLVAIPVSNGTATATWEIVGADPTTVESISFTVILASDKEAGLGVASARGSIGPVGPPDVWNGTPPVPLFVEDVSPSASKPAFRIAATLERPQLLNVSSASLSGSTVAPGSMVTSFGVGFPTSTSASRTSVDVIDANGVKQPARVTYLSDRQANYVLESSTAKGVAVVNVSNGGTVFATGFLQVEAVAPALFSANASGSGPATGEVARVAGSAVATSPLATFNAAQGVWAATPIDLGASSDVALLTLYGTGIRGRSSTGAVKLTVGGVDVPILYAGEQKSIEGLDLISAGPLPQSLRGSGEVPIVLTVDGKTANRVTMSFQ